MNELKGYGYKEVTKRMVSKNKYVLSGEVEASITRDALNEKISTAISNKGRVFFIRKKGEVNGVVIFRFEEHSAEEFIIDETKGAVTKNDYFSEAAKNVMDKVVELDSKPVGTKKMKAKKLEKINQANAYVMDSFICTEELKKLENIIMIDTFDLLKVNYTMMDVNGVKILQWGDNITADRTIGSSSASAISIGMCLGMSVGILFGELLFDNIGTGMCFGMAIGIFVGMTYYASANKKKEK